MKKSNDPTVFYKCAPHGYKWIYVFSYKNYIDNPNKSNKCIRINSKTGETVNSVWGRTSSEINASTPEPIVILRVYLVSKNVSDKQIHKLISQHGGISVYEESKKSDNENTHKKCGLEWYITELKTIDDIVINVFNGELKYSANNIIKNKNIITNNTSINKNNKKADEDVNTISMLFKLIYNSIDTNSINTISSLYINFVNFLKIHPEWLWENFYSEIPGEPSLYDSSHFRCEFNSYLRYSNISLEECINSYEIDIKYIFDQLYKIIKKYDFDSMIIYKGIKFNNDINEFIAFNTNLYNDKNTEFRFVYSELMTKISNDTSMLLYRMNFDIFDKIFLWKGYSLENITIIVNSEIMKNSWFAYIFNKYEKYIPSKEYIINNIKVIPHNEIDKYNFNNMHYDVVLANPPFAGGKHEKFLEKFLEISDIVCTIQPNSYLYKGGKGNKTIKNILNDSFVRINDIEANNFFDAGFQNVISILYCDKNRKNDIEINNYKFDNINDIKIFDTDKYLASFYNNTKQLLNDNCGDKWFGSDGSHYPERIIKFINNPYCLKCALIRGHKDANGLLDDFYTYIPKSDKLEKHNYLPVKYDSAFLKRKQKDGKIDMQYYFTFKSKIEADNFIKYLQTDFARAFQLLFKNDNNIRWQNLPWFDFSDIIFSKSVKEIDDYLFKKYNISDEIRKHIEYLLPDYYKIR